MARILAAVLFAVLVGLAQSSQAAENQYVCALAQAFECTPAEGCKAWSIEEMALPRFIQVDYAAKTIRSLDKDVQREVNTFSDVTKLEGIIVVHGVEKRGWSMTLNEQSGALALSATGDAESFVVFGNCLKP